MSTQQTAAKAMDTIQRCINILHDLSAPSPQAAAQTLRALRDIDTPAALAVGELVEAVAEARHGSGQINRARRGTR
jgi:hypothetical protein